VEKYGTARQATDDNITSRMRFACWVNKVTATHSEYAILIAVPRQQWVREGAFMLRYSALPALYFVWRSQIGISITAICLSTCAFKQLTVAGSVIKQIKSSCYLQVPNEYSQHVFVSARFNLH
jgi:hypothetical protein